jgi:hypothetical protein
MATATLPCTGRSIALPERKPAATTEIKIDYFVELLCIFTTQPAEFSQVARGFALSGLR